MSITTNVAITAFMTILAIIAITVFKVITIIISNITKPTNVKASMYSHSHLSIAIYEVMVGMRAIIVIKAFILITALEFLYNNTYDIDLGCFSIIFKCYLFQQFLPL